MKIKKAIIPVAGLGTRFLPATKAIPKEMFPIVDKPSIQYIVEEALNSGIEQIIFINAHGKEVIEDHFDTNLELETILKGRKQESLLEEIYHLSRMANIVTIRQKSPLGLGHAILCAKEIIGNEPFAVLLGDDLVDAQKPCLSQMIDIYQKEQAPVVALMEVPKNQTHLYGIVDIKCGGQPHRNPDSRIYDICSFIEKPAPQEAPSRLAIVGRYLLTPEIFNCLSSTPAGKGGEIQLTDALQRMLEIKTILGYRYHGKRIDVGDKLGFLHANIYFGLKRPEFKDSLKKLLKELE